VVYVAGPEVTQVTKERKRLNSKTGERKFKIRDGSGLVFRSALYPDSYPLSHGSDYIPRACARVISRQEYWSGRIQEFESSLYFKIEPSSEWREQMLMKTMIIEEITGYRAMHDSLWKTFLTPDCVHDVPLQVESPIRPGQEAAVLMDWNNSLEFNQTVSERIFILLTRSDPHLRWLAIISGAFVPAFAPMHREIMLRSLNRCDECALLHVSPMAGRWILIL
jgi:hypothetical protein